MTRAGSKFLGLVALVLVAGPALAQTDAEGSDGAAVRAAFKEYRAAVRDADGVRLTAAVSARTVAFYQRSLDRALDADSATVAGLPFFEQLDVLAYRHRIPVDTLRALDGRGAVRYTVEAGWIPADLSRRQLPDGVAVRGDSATVGVRVVGEGFPKEGLPIPGLAFPFVREADGRWRLDMVSMVRGLMEGVRRRAEQSGTPLGEFLTDALSEATGEPVDPGIWNPVGRD